MRPHADEAHQPDPQSSTRFDRRPRRVGTAKAAALMQAPGWNAGLLTELGRTMMDASICGLGQAAPNPMQSVLRYFAHEVGAPTDAPAAKEETA